MLERGLCLAFELRDNTLGQDFSELDAPLIERVDVPDDTLGEDAVLVECDKLAECLGCKPIGENRIRRPVALENTMRHEPIRRAFSLDLLRRLAKRQCFRL